MRLHPGTLAAAVGALTRSFGPTRFRRYQKSTTSGSFGPNEGWSATGSAFRGRLRHLREDEGHEYQSRTQKRLYRLTCPVSVTIPNTDRIRDEVRGVTYEIVAIGHDPSALDRYASVYILSEVPS